MTYNYKDKNGSVELFKNGQIIVVNLKGACGTRLIDFYSKTLQTLAAEYDGEPWAYLCNGIGFQAATPEAQKTIVATYKACMRLGCRYSAYCYDTALGKAQTQEIMNECGSYISIESILFENEKLAEAYLIEQLDTLNHSSSKTVNAKNYKAS